METDPAPVAEPSRASFGAEAVARDARAHGLVVVAGAGLSMGPPASLPGWVDINNAFLSSLAMCVARHTQGAAGFDMAEFIAERRDTVAMAQPDLQAQLAEESVGEHYFALFEPLDIETWNEGHAALAAIAASGALRAVVTTNFDRLIELAMRAAGAEPEVFASPDDFDRLTGLDAAGSLPVIKVHGSVDRPDTMVDTLRQRVVGRPPALEAALVRLFSQHAVLVIGFSGADLAFDPQYLGLREGAAASPSFTIVNRAGQVPNAALVELADTAGRRTRIVDGNLPDAATALATALGQHGLFEPGYDTEMDYPGMRRAGLSSAVDRSFGEGLSPVRATVVLASIAEAAGSTDAAYRLLTGTMPFHLKAGMHQDPALPEQLCMIAATLIDAGHIDAGLSGNRFKGELTATTVLSADVVQSSAIALALVALADARLDRGAEVG